MSMQGWRIEVRGEVECYHGRSWSPDMTDPNGPTLTVYAVVIAPLIVKANFYGSRALLFAAVWPLRDTIYVSRPVTDAEADTLRELLDAEMRREREERPERITLPQREDIPAEVTRRPWAMTGTYGTQAEFEAKLREVTATMARSGEEMRRAMNTKALGEQIKRHVASGELKGAPRIETEQVAAFLGKAAPRVPQVGDVIEVRSVVWRLEDWTLVEVSGYGNSQDEYLFSLPWPIRHGSVRREHEGVYWRWPAETPSGTRGSLELTYLSPRLKAALELREGDAVLVMVAHSNGGRWSQAIITKRDGNGFAAKLVSDDMTVERSWTSPDWRTI